MCIISMINEYSIVQEVYGLENQPARSLGKESTLGALKSCLSQGSTGL